MKLAILSDIHGNIEALDAVLSDLESFRPDRIVSLGDMVGYGPDPEAVINRIIDRGITCVLGNHEAALSSEQALGWLNFLAKDNNIATKALLSEKSLAFCAALPRYLSIENGRFVHGCPPHSILKYLHRLSDAKIADLVEALPEKRFFVGHTHQLQLITIDRQSVTRIRLKEGVLQLDADATYLVNVGSVGHPRDGNGKAKYALWDSEADTVEIRGVAYPARLTAEKIIARGFSKVYAICIYPSLASADT